MKRKASISSALSAVIRQHILASGKTAAQIGRETGIPQPRISAFLRGDDIRLSTAEKLAEYLGLKLVAKP